MAYQDYKMIIINVSVGHLLKWTTIANTSID